MGHIQSCHGSSLHVPHAYRQDHCCLSVLLCEWDPTWSRLLGSSVASAPRNMFWDWLPKPFAINCPSLFFQPWEGVITYFFLGDTACGRQCLPAPLLPPAISSLWSRRTHFPPYIHLLFLEFFCPLVVVYKCQGQVLTSIASSCSLLTFLTSMSLPWYVVYVSKLVPDRQEVLVTSNLRAISSSMYPYTIAFLFNLF